MTRTTRSAPSVRPLLVLPLVIALSGCGTIFGGTTKMLSVNSTPSQARLTTEPLTAEFTTPATLTLERKKSYTLVVWAEGYREAQFPIQRKMRVGVLVLDILFGLVPVIVDAATGGWWDLQPEVASVTLQRLEDFTDGPEVIEVTISTSPVLGEVTVGATEIVHVEVIEH